MVLYIGLLMTRLKAYREIQFWHHRGHELVSPKPTSRLILNREIKVVYCEYASKARIRVAAVRTYSCHWAPNG
jgi:hypothetical protein